MKVTTIDGHVVEVGTEEIRRAAHAVGMDNSFFTHYRDKAAENIRAALGCKEAPRSEEDVKWAICTALKHGSSKVVAEVMFEAMEWQTAYAALKQK